MARVEYGTVTFADTTSKSQLRSTNGRVLSITVKARSGNVGEVYFGTDTAVSSTDGWELLPGDREDWEFTGSHDATAFRALATDSGDALDWAMEMQS